MFYFINLDTETEKRFDLTKFFEYTDNFDPLTSYFSTNVVNLPQAGTFVVSGEDGRPDLISQTIYGDTQYWWIIMAYNDVKEITDLKTGDELKYPSIESLEDFYFSLKIKAAAAGR